MVITSKSLYHANIVFVFRDQGFMFPDNAALAALYQGEESKGARFIDDPILQTKILELPQLKLQVVVEPSRLRFEDLSQEEPEKTNLVREAVRVYQRLLKEAPIVGFGFNFDIYYRFSDVIRLNDIFANFAEKKILEKADLRDFGSQFTLEKEGGKKREQYFIKIIAPLELSVHVNHHFSAKELPFLPPELGKPPDSYKSKPFFLQQLFERCYNETDEVIKHLRL